jgi:hypothetical protein
MADVFVTKIVTISSGFGFDYIVRPNEDAEGQAVDLCYQEDDTGAVFKYICITPEMVPHVIAALQEWLDEYRIAQSRESNT